MLDLDVRQVRTALDAEPPTRKKSSGRPPKLNGEQRQILVKFVCRDRKTRRMSFKELAFEFCHWEAGPEAIENALKREGFVRDSICDGQASDI